MNEPHGIKNNRYIYTMHKKKRCNFVKIRPRKTCNYPNLGSFGWVSYDKVGVIYSGELGNRSARHVLPISEATRGSGGIELKATSLRRQRKWVLYARTCSIGRPAGGHSVSPLNNLTNGVVGRTKRKETPPRPITLQFCENEKSDFWTILGQSSVWSPSSFFRKHCFRQK